MSRKLDVIRKWVELNEKRSALLKFIQDYTNSEDEKQDSIINVLQFDYDRSMMNKNYNQAKKSIEKLIELLIRKIQKKHCK